MNLYAFDQPADVNGTDIYAQDPRVPDTPQSLELGATLEAGTIEAQSATLSAAGWRVVIDMGDFEYLASQSASVEGDLSFEHTPTGIEIEGGPVASQSAAVSGTFLITGSSSGWIDVTPAGGTWMSVTIAGGSWVDV